MAVTVLWRVKGYIGKVLLYAENPEKTSNPEIIQVPKELNRDILEDVIAYAGRDKATNAIDFERNTITIKRTVASVNIDGKVTIIEQDSAKTKSSLRTLPLVSQFREYFLSVKEAQKENKKVCGNSYDYSHDGYVFVDALGRRMKPDYISSTFSVLLEKKGLKRIRFHDLRHSCASLLLANGVPMKQIQEWLGHSDFNTTANIYAHLDYSSKVTSAQAMEKVLPLPAGFNTNGWNGVVSV